MRYFQMPVFLCLCILLLAGCGYTPKIKALHAGGVPVHELKKVTIGGVDQWLLIRGQDRKNPVLLFLHGGPGTSELPLLRKYNKELEKFYTVVTWDQRGAGKSNKLSVPSESFTLDRILADEKEVTDYLKKEFLQPKIFLIGHSWGSILGMMSVNQHPEDYYAYIGIGQVVCSKENLLKSCDTIYKLAGEKGHAREISTLANVGITRNHTGEITLKDAIKMYNWIECYARVFYTRNGHFQLGKAMTFSSELTVYEKRKYLAGVYRSKHLLWNDEFLAIDFKKDIRKVDVPVYFVQGAHDFITCSDLLKKYTELLDAPVKQLVMFDRSAHCPIFEEPEKFNALMIDQILKHAKCLSPDERLYGSLQVQAAK